MHPQLPMDEIDRIETCKDALSESYSTFVMILTENYFFKYSTLTSMKFVERLKKRENDIKCQGISKPNQVPSLHGGANPISKNVSHQSLISTLKLVM